MTRSPHQRSLPTCVLSAHPLVLEELSGLLAGRRFQPHAVRLNGIIPPDLHKLRPCPVLFVVDAAAPIPNSAAIVSSILAEFPNARALAVAEQFNADSSFILLRAGARGLLTYAEARKRLAEACRLVAAGELWVPRLMLSHFLDWIGQHAGHRIPKPGPVELTNRGQEVLIALMENLSNKEIANRLHMSERTVKFHISRLLALYGVHHRGDLIVRLLPYLSDRTVVTLATNCPPGQLPLPRSSR